MQDNGFIASVEAFESCILKQFGRFCDPNLKYIERAAWGSSKVSQDELRLA
jgi:hypothetical protein